MGLFRGIDGPSSESDPGRRLTPAHEERRRAIRSGIIASGTLACDRCDAPIALGSEAVTVTQLLSCPYCDRTGPVRDFLSLKAPTRPARVLVRLIKP